MRGSHHPVSKMEKLSDSKSYVSINKLLFILLIFFFILTACSKNIADVSLTQLPENYSLEDAKSDDCVVFENSDITYGQTKWDKFIQEAEDGKTSTVRLAFHFTLGDPSRYSKELYEEMKDDYPSLHVMDLSFDGKKYIIEIVEDGRLVSKEYQYLMKYEGRTRSGTATFSEYTYYVLVDDNTVTWDDIEHGMISSQSGDWIDHYKVYSDIVLK